MKKIHVVYAANIAVALFVLTALSASALPLLNVESGTSTTGRTSKILQAGDNASGESLGTQISPLTFSTASPTKTKTSTSPQRSATLASPVTSAATAPTLGPNLIQNPGFETAAGSLPQGWAKGGYGTNTRVLTYPVTSFDGSKAVSVQISAYTSGDAKWYFTDVPVTAGATYQFSDQYISDVPTIVDVRFTMSDGTFKYLDIGFPAASAQIHTTSYQFKAPASSTSATIFHVINRVGTLTLDNYSLNEVQSGTTPPPPPADGVVPNGNLEQTDGTNPTSWKPNRWGSVIATFTYPVTGFDGSKAVKTTITSRPTNGDAKWYFQPITLSPGIYTYADQWTATVPSSVTVQFENNDGTFTYEDLGTVPARGWSWLEADFTVPAGVKSVTVLHLINSVGSLTIDNIKITKKAELGGIFQTGAVTLRFDDGWGSQFDNAVPKLNAAGLKGTFYIVTRQLQDYGFSGFMSIAKVKQLAAQGHEIGAHTRTHQDLTKLTSAQAQQEIVGSRQDILGWNVGSVKSFAYPYGAYNATILQMVKSAGFSNAAATIGGFAVPTSDPYQLEREPVDLNISLDQLKSWVDQAQSGKKWLILNIHRVETSEAACNGDQYCTSVSTFNGLVDYIVQKGIPVVTPTQAIQSLQ